MKNTSNNINMNKSPINVLKVYHEWTRTSPAKRNVEQVASRLAAQYSNEELRLASIMSNVWMREKGDAEVEVKAKVIDDNDGGVA
jgi:hypothetical protein